MILPDIIFKARRVDNGEWIEGNYAHIVRKGTSHNIMEKFSNEWYEIYRESLHISYGDGTHWLTLEGKGEESKWQKI